MSKHRKPMSEEDKRKRSEANIRYWDSHRKEVLNKNGYLSLCVGNKREYVHRIVMEEHLGRKLTDNEAVHHINGDRTDNRIENLQLLSRAEHSKLHAIKNGLGKSNVGKEPPNKTPKETIETILEMRKAGTKLADICKETGISYPTVQKYAKEIK